MKPAEEEVAFYHQLGEAITRWAFVEISLLHVAEFCVHEREREVLAAGYHSIENFRSKLSFVDSIVRHAHQEEEVLSMWATLHKRVEKRASSRNKLAHWYRMSFPEQSNPQGSRIALVDWVKFKGLPWEVKTTGKTPQGSLCLRDIALIGSQFGELAIELANFATSLGGLPKLYPRLVAQEAHHPEIRAIRERIRQALEIPLKKPPAATPAG